MSLDSQAQISNQEIFNAIQLLQQKVESTSKKQRLSETEVPFKSEGNRQQYNHVESVVTLIESALSSLELADFTAVKATLQEAPHSLKQRQKLIKLADRSSLGWATVHCRRSCGPFQR